MPFYEYECKCGRVVEEFYPIDERPKSIQCLCGKRASFVLSATRTDFKFTDKEVRIPSNPTSVPTWKRKP